MDTNVFLVGKEQAVLIFAEVNGNTKEELKNGRVMRIPAMNFRGREYACANFKIYKLGQCEFNGKTYRNIEEVCNELNRIMTTGSWLLAERLTTEDDKVIGYGVIRNGRYFCYDTNTAIQHADFCENAFIRDGVLVNKCGETPKRVIQAPTRASVPIAPIKTQDEINAANGRVSINENRPLVAPKINIPIVSNATNSENNAKLQRMDELIKIINEATKVYEQGQDELMTNKEWDTLYDELLQLEEETGVIKANSPTQNVGSEVVSGLTKEQHDEPMLSLGKTKSISDLKEFIGTKMGVLSWKLDGLTVVLTYEGGELRKAVTRGNGHVGELVTNNAKQFINLPHKISRKDKIVLRSEALISYADFDNIKQTPEGAEYKNPRNLCSGSVRQLDSAVTARRHVRAVIFEWVNAPKGMSKREQLDFCKSMGFEVVDNVPVSYDRMEEAVAGFAAMIEKFKYPSDGLVLTFDDVDYGKSLGVRAKTPRHSIAFKWQDEVVETELLDIDWTVGRTGVITPTAIFKPVDIEGTTVNRASLHNLSVMEELLGQPYVGQKIKVYKANMIIPQILSAERM